MPSVLVACEMGGRVRSAFAKRGWDSWSCDLLPDESEMWCEEPGGRHYQGNVLPILGQSWDLIICHPPCTDLSQAGARYWKQKQEDGRQRAAVQFFLKMFDYANKGAYVVVENPNGIMSRPPVGRVPDQVVQPWMFGDPLIKETHLWYRDANESIGWYRDSLPHLIPTHTLADYPQTTLGRTVTGGGSWRTDKKNGKVGMNKNWEDSQGRARRNILRSITPQGLAQAFADQWGAYVESKRVL